MSNMQERLVKMIRIAYLHQKSLIAALSDEEKAAAGYENNWSPKDNMAHMAHWDSELANNLSILEKHSGQGNDHDVDQLNAVIWNQYRDSSWPEVESMVEKAQQALIESIETLVEGQLTDPEMYEWSNGRPVWKRIIFGSYYHTMQHLAELYSRRGQLEKANALQEESAEAQISLDDADSWRGNVLYNLACHYALTGQKTLAVQKIRQSFALYPYLKEWALEDGDLDHLRDDPDFQAIIEED